LSDAISKETSIKDINVNASPKQIYDKIRRIKTPSSSPLQVCYHDQNQLTSVIVI